MKKRNRRRHADVESISHLGGEDVAEAAASKRSRCDDTVVTAVSDSKSTTVRSIKSQSSSSNSNDERRHAFNVTNVLDHCETPRLAYEHIVEFLELLSQSLKSQKSTDIQIWDPYYCNGGMKRTFQSLGYTNIIHENVDFYKPIRQESTIPMHQVLITNPPYSDNHIHRLLEFVIQIEIPKQRPVCLLLPNWVSRQPDYDERFVQPLAAKQCELFYLSPILPYTYTMPSWVNSHDRPEHVGDSGETTPYLSSWYIIIPSSFTSRCSGDGNNKSFMEKMDTLSKKQRPIKTTWVVAKTVKGLKWKIKKLRQNKGKKVNK
jgi:hypothetical protein